MILSSFILTIGSTKVLVIETGCEMEVRIECVVMIVFIVVLVVIAIGRYMIDYTLVILGGSECYQSGIKMFKKDILNSELVRDDDYTYNHIFIIRIIVIIIIWLCCDG